MQPRYYQAVVTKRGGMGDRSQSVLIVPMKLANSAPLEPLEGSETSVTEPLLRNTTNASQFDNRVYETAADSSVGETTRFSNFGCVTTRSETVIRGAVCPSAGMYGSVGALGR